MSTFWHNVKLLPLAAFAFYAILIVAIYSAISASLGGMLNSAWKLYYRYKAIVCSLYLMYIIFRLFGLVHIGEYRLVITWLTIFVALCLAWPSMLHVWERKAIVKKIEHDRHPE